MFEDVGGWLDIVDTAATIMNGLRGAGTLRDQLGSSVQLHDSIWTGSFTLPRENYGLVFLLDVLYHLQNHCDVMRDLAARASHCLPSAKVTRIAGTRSDSHR